MTDKQLLNRIQEKSATAFGELYARYHRSFLGWTNSKLNDWDAASDLLQEFWTYIWLSPEEIKTDEKESAKAYLSRNLSFRILRYFHKMSLRKEIADDVLVQQVMGNFAYSHVSEDLDVKEIQVLIDDILARMPAVTQRIYELRCLENLSVKETSEKLALKEGTVRNGLSTALSTLRKELASSYETKYSVKAKVLLPLLIMLLSE